MEELTEDQVAELALLEAEIEQRIKDIEQADLEVGARLTEQEDTCPEPNAEYGAPIDTIHEGVVTGVELSSLDTPSSGLLEEVSDWLLKSEEKKEKVPIGPAPLNHDERNTLDDLDVWAGKMSCEGSGAAKAYGAVGMRAEHVFSFGRLALPKARPLSNGAMSLMAKLEMKSKPRQTLREKQSLNSEAQIERAHKEVDDVISQIENQVLATTTTLVEHTGGGVAAPSMAAFRAYYESLPKPMQRVAVTMVVTFAIILYVFFYEVHEEVEEEMVEALGEEGIGFAESG